MEFLSLAGQCRLFICRTVHIIPPPSFDNVLIKCLMKEHFDDEDCEYLINHVDEARLINLHKFLNDKFHNKLSFKGTMSELEHFGSEYSEEIMFSAAEFNNVNVIDFLIHKPDDFESLIQQGLFGAAKGGHFDLAQRFIELGADHHKNYDDSLSFAAMGGNVDIVKCLYKIYINDDDIDIDNFTKEWIEKAICHGSLNVLKYFLDECGMEFDMEYGMELAARCNHMNMIEYALSTGASNIQDCYNTAVDHGHMELILYFTNLGGKADIENMHEAAQCGHLNVVRYFVELGFNDERGMLDAIYGSNIDIVRYFVDLGYHNWNLYFEYASTGFPHSETKLRTTLLKYFISMGADNEESCINAAISRNGCIDMERLLNLRPRDKTYLNELALNAAKSKSCTDYVIGYLVKLGADNGNECFAILHDYIK